MKKVEDLVNQKIKEDLPVEKKEMRLDQALKSGALAFFKERYPEIVKVYSIGNFSKEEMHVAIGRFPVKTAMEAERTVDKLISYDENSGSFRDWRNRLAFFADDEDSNQHIKDADGIAELVRSDYKKFNVDKYYIDAFPQESTPAGDLSPQVNEGINNTVFKDVGMPNIFWKQEGVKEPIFEEHDGEKVVVGTELVKKGTMNPEEFDTMIRDLVTYLAYMGEPNQSYRKTLGVYVLIFLVVLFGLAYAMKKDYWKDVH